MSTPRKLSPTDVKSVVGSTWFDLEEGEDRLVLDTREHGDVGSESPGQPDILEARRMAAALRKSFPRHEVRLEAVDEWVTLEVYRSEKSKEKLEREARDRRAERLKGTWEPHITAALSSAKRKCLGENAESKNYAPPFSWERSLSPGPKSCTTTFRSEYGERHLYRDHQGAIPAFKTPEESRLRFLELARELGGTIKAQRVNAPWKKHTYNRPAPNNVIEEVGHVSYDVELPLAPPPRPRPLGKGLARSPHGAMRRTVPPRSV
jgi:hypothetical protein